MTKKDYKEFLSDFRLSEWKEGEHNKYNLLEFYRHKVDVKLKNSWHYIIAAQVYLGRLLLRKWSDIKF